VYSIGWKQILNAQAGLEKYAGPDHWNDPDMLEVGNPGLSLAESRAQFSLWCMLAAPLMAGNDLRKMSPEILKILTNRQAIATHYEFANDFYLRFLDPSRCYSQAVFERDDESLETAQRRKLDFAIEACRLKPGDRVLEAASKKGLGVTIMKSNPLGRYYSTMERVEQLKKDGQPVDERLQKSMEQMADMAKQAESFIQKNGLKTAAEVKAAALKFVLADPRVHTLNLAFNTFDDVQNLLALSGQPLGGKDRVLLASYEKDCGSLYCRHACGLCEADCPNGVPVNTIMRYNHYFEAQGSEKYAMGEYAALETAKADACRTCEGPCERACPYGVPVRALLCMAHSQLTLP
ncbi:MAG: hypothetical protein HGA24_00760, partial [Candidatus Aminicenantes bacterium]|nr:hypothetical protein [Candidatus Aminicenantes bacterium]